MKEKKVTGVANAKKRWSMEIIKQNANAIRNENADVFVEPILEIEVYRKDVTITVIGWAATYKYFRPVNAEDVLMLQIGTHKKQMFTNCIKAIEKWHK